MDTESITDLQLTAIHEAAHAVIGALGGLEVVAISAVPEGADMNAPAWTGWIDMDGAEGLIQWDGKASEYKPVLTRQQVREHFKSGNALPLYYRSLTYQNPKKAEPITRRALPEWYRDIRAVVCSLVAGELAEEIEKGVTSFEDCYHELSYFSARGTDTAKTLGFCQFLPWRDEDEKLQRLTFDTLREAETWAATKRLANELEKKKQLSGAELQRLLPPQRKGWPKGERKSIRGC